LPWVIFVSSCQSLTISITCLMINPAIDFLKLIYHIILTLSIHPLVDQGISSACRDRNCLSPSHPNIANRCRQYCSAPGWRTKEESGWDGTSALGIKETRWGIDTVSAPERRGPW